MVSSCKNRLHEKNDCQKTNAKVILQNFFEWCPRDVFLSVRSDNEKACKFYEQIGMSLVGETSWARGTLPGKVYVMRK